MGREVSHRGQALAWRLGVVIAVGACAASTAWAGPPFVTDDPEPVDLGHWEVYAFTSGAIDAKGASGVGPALEVDYGAAPNLQLHLIANVAWDRPPDRPGVVGPGDTELGVKYRLVTAGPGDWWPQVGIYPLLELPSGDARRNLGAGYVQAFLPVWLRKDFGKWTTTGGGGYWINPGPGNLDYWFAGWLLQRQVTDRLELGVEVFHTTPNMIGRSETTAFTVSGHYKLGEHYHLLFSAGRGGLSFAVDADQVTDPITYYLGFQWTF